MLKLTSLALLAASVSATPHVQNVDILTAPTTDTAFLEQQGWFGTALKSVGRVFTGHTKLQDEWLEAKVNFFHGKENVEKAKEKASNADAACTAAEGDLKEIIEANTKTRATTESAEALREKKRLQVEKADAAVAKAEEAQEDSGVATETATRKEAVTKKLKEVKRKEFTEAKKVFIAASKKVDLIKSKIVDLQAKVVTDKKLVKNLKPKETAKKATEKEGKKKESEQILMTDMQKEKEKEQAAEKKDSQKDVEVKSKMKSLHKSQQKIKDVKALIDLAEGIIQNPKNSAAVEVPPKETAKKATEKEEKKKESEQILMTDTQTVDPPGSKIKKDVEVKSKMKSLPNAQKALKTASDEETSAEKDKKNKKKEFETATTENSVALKALAAAKEQGKKAATKKEDAQINADKIKNSDDGVNAQEAAEQKMKQDEADASDVVDHARKVKEEADAELQKAEKELVHLREKLAKARTAYAAEKADALKKVNDGIAEAEKKAAEAEGEEKEAAMTKAQMEKAKEENSAKVKQVHDKKVSIDRDLQDATKKEADAQKSKVNENYRASELEKKSAELKKKEVEEAAQVPKDPGYKAPTSTANLRGN